MAYFPPNSCNIYYISLVGNYLHRPRIAVTSHWVATSPGGALDNLTACLTRVATVMWGVYDAFTGVGPVFQFAEGRLWAWDRQVSPLTIFRGSSFPAAFAGLAPEAAILIRRVGAGPVNQSFGRMLLPGCTDGLFTDFPKCRHIDTTSPRITSAMTGLTTTIAAIAPDFTEVLFDRRSGGAWTINAYTVASRVARVWQRAGWPHR